MKCASFNVLADAYIGNGDYSHVNPELLQPLARIDKIINLITDLKVDVIGLQEAEAPLVDALDHMGKWQTFWSPKGRNKPDGCLTLVKPTIEVNAFETRAYTDGSGHIVQTLQIGRVVFANTHIKWAPQDGVNHIGVLQATELIKIVGPEKPAVIFADCNDKPNGPVRALIESAGFANICGDGPTAIVNQELVALDLLAVRGFSAKCSTKRYDLTRIPGSECPSDHIPISADLMLN